MIQLEETIITNENDKPEKETSVLSMKFKVRKHHVDKGKMRIK